MKRQEEILLLIVITAAVVGVVQVTGKASVDGASVKASAAVTNSAMRRGLADAYRPGADDGDWQAPRWSILSSGSSLLRANHPLYRRPGHPGENMYSVICGSWGGWYYDPPSEQYF
jgi:hypothetical protein